MNSQSSNPARSMEEVMSNPVGRSLLSPVVLALCLVVGAGGARAADVKERNLKLSYVTAKESPYGLGVEKFAELASQKSGGKIKVKGTRTASSGARCRRSRAPRVACSR